MVGVLGGMGPLATVDFLQKVIEVTPATRDQEHVPMAILQSPQIPDRSAAILSGSDEPFPPMLQGLSKLRDAGAKFVVIPCNSAHHWYEQLLNAQPLEILHIADAVLHELQRRDLAPGPVGILATRGTNQSGFYAKRLSKRGFAVTPVDEGVQQLTDEAIGAVKGGHLSEAADLVDKAANRLLSAGARTLVLACTELPIALEGNSVLSRCIDSTLELARYCVAESTHNDR